MRVDSTVLPVSSDFTLNTGSLPTEDVYKKDTKEIDPAIKPELSSENEKQLELATEQANKALEGVKRHFKYEMHEATKQVVISVIDNETNEVIGEIPPKKLLDAVAKLWELTGLFVDERR
ncbi:MAG: flagellar protein FlaG [Thermincola sp.]|jgi:flagellar protein FlaG|nr:flagellar protein FlaG [Thermincola sp.]MDT3703374.1 flagellar protein FlaG [Thermincola sp.]